jgi:hypothetical protein
VYGQDESGEDPASTDEGLKEAQESEKTVKSDE